MSDFFFRKLQAVEAMAPYRLRTTWSTGEVLDVDVEPVLRGIPALAEVLEPKVFAKAHLAEWGSWHRVVRRRTGGRQRVRFPWRGTNNCYQKRTAMSSSSAGRLALTPTN